MQYAVGPGQIVSTTKVVRDCVEELKAAALFFVEDDKRKIRLEGASYDSRERWATVTDPTIAQKVAGKTGFKYLPAVVEWLLSIQDGTGQIERDLGCLTRLLDAHSGPLDEHGVTVDDLALLSFHLPEKQDRIVSGNDNCLGLTDLSTEWQKEWIDKHGRRFCCYKTRRDCGKKRPVQEGTAKEVKRSSKAARNALATRTGTHNQSFIPGVSLKALAWGPSRQEPAELQWNEKLKAFHELTQKKKQVAQAEAMRRKQGATPYIRPQEKKGGIFQPAPASIGKGKPSFFPVAIDACKQKLSNEDLTLIRYGALKRFDACCSQEILFDMAQSSKPCCVIMESFAELGRLDGFNFCFEFLVCCCFRLYNVKPPCSSTPREVMQTISGLALEPSMLHHLWRCLLLPLAPQLS